MRLSGLSPLQLTQLVEFREQVIAVFLQVVHAPANLLELGRLWTALLKFCGELGVHPFVSFIELIELIENPVHALDSIFWIVDIHVREDFSHRVPEFCLGLLTRERVRGRTIRCRHEQVLRRVLRKQVAEGVVFLQDVIRQLHNVKPLRKKNGLLVVKASAQQRIVTSFAKTTLTQNQQRPLIATGDETESFVTWQGTQALRNKGSALGELCRLLAVRVDREVPVQLEDVANRAAASRRS